MPIIRIQWRDQQPPCITLAISAHGMPSRRIRTRATLSLNVAENVLSPRLIKQMNLIPAGHTRIHRSGKAAVVPFYFIDLHLTLGLLGAVVDRYTYRGVMAVPASRSAPRAGLVIGTDLIRRGRLMVDADGVALCL